LNPSFAALPIAASTPTHPPQVSKILLKIHDLQKLAVMMETEVLEILTW
jgi:hypothetical protein